MFRIHKKRFVESKGKEGRFSGIKASLIEEEKCHKRSQAGGGLMGAQRRKEQREKLKHRHRPRRSERIVTKKKKLGN